MVFLIVVSPMGWPWTLCSRRRFETPVAWRSGIRVYPKLGIGLVMYGSRAAGLH